MSDTTSATPLNLPAVPGVYTPPGGAPAQSVAIPSAKEKATPLVLPDVKGVYEKPPAPTAEQTFNAQIESKIPDAKKYVEENPSEAYVPSAYGLPLVGEPYRRAVAATRAATGMGQGKTFDERYADMLAESKALEVARRQAAPISSNLIQGTAEAVPSMFALPELGIEAGMSRAMPYLEKGAGYIGRMLEGAIYGGTSGMQDTVPGQTAEDTAKKTLTGAATGAATVPVVSAITKVAQAPKAAYDWVSSLWNPEKAVAKDIAAAAANAPVTQKGQGLTVPEFVAAQQQGQPVTIADIRGGKPLVSQAAATVPSDKNIDAINENLVARLGEQSQRVGQDVDAAFGKKIDAFQTRKEADDVARSVNKPAYDAAYAAPEAQSIWNDQLRSMVNTNEGKEALKFALNESNKAAAKEGQSPMANPFVTDSEGNLTLKEGVTPNLAFWDYFKRGLNDVSGEQFNRGSRSASTSTSNMATELTDFLKQQVPSYETALNGAGKFIRGNNAHDEGMNFIDLIANRNSDPKEVGKIIDGFDNKYSTDEKRLFGEGVAADIKENPAKAAKLFASGDLVALDRLRNVIGNDAFSQIETSMRLNRIMALTKEIGKPQPAPTLSAKNVVLGAGTLGLTGTIGTWLPKLQEAIPNITKYASDPMALAATFAALSTGALASTLSKASNKAKAGATLSMALSNDPKIHDMLLKASQSDAETREILTEFEQGMSRYLASTQTENVRPGRASGGSVIDKKADALVNETLRNRKLYSDHTEHMLSMPDDAIVQALNIAKQFAA